MYEPAPARRPGQMGRPRKKGRRLPTLAARLADPATIWAAVTVTDWYGEGARTVEVASDTAVWYHNGLPPVPLRWVLVRDPQGQFDPQALLCTDLAADPAQILAWFVLRWHMEVTFAEARRHLGVETRRQWSDLAIRRTTPALLGLFSLVTPWAHPRMAVTGDLVRQTSLVPQAPPDLQRRAGAGAAGVMGTDGLLHVRSRPRHRRTPARLRRPLDGHALLRRLTSAEGPKSS